MRIPLLILATFLLAGTSGSPTPIAPTAPPAVRVKIDVPDSAGTAVRLRYLQGPDSLRGTARELIAPSEFVVAGGDFVLLATRAKGHGAVRLRVERIGTTLMGEGTGDRVRIEISTTGVWVRTLPWWIPI